MMMGIKINRKKIKLGSETDQSIFTLPHSDLKTPKVD